MPEHRILLADAKPELTVWEGEEYPSIDELVQLRQSHQEAPTFLVQRMRTIRTLGWKTIEKVTIDTKPPTINF